MKELLKQRGWVGACLITCLILVSGCKKGSNIEPAPKPDNVTIGKVAAWLDGNKNIKQPDKADKIETLKSNLNFKDIHKEPFNAQEDFLVISVNEGFKQKFAISSNRLVYLLLIQNKNGTIRKGNIVIFTPNNNESVTGLPDQTFTKIFSSSQPSVMGKFSFLSVTGTRQNEATFTDDNVYSYGSIKTKDLASSRTTSCIDWYLVTTYHWADGTTTQDEVYVGTTCDDCSESMMETICPDTGSGPSAGNGDLYEYEEIMVPSTQNWIVSFADSWYVKSYETLNGKKISNGQSKFIQPFTHNSSALFKTMVGSDASWTQLSVASAFDPDFCKTTISGKVTFDLGVDVEVNNKQKLWAAWIVFP
jgi:hypothetical protein